jgi:hypothetical protein
VEDVVKAFRSIAIGALLTSAKLGAYPHAQSQSQLDRARIDQIAKEAAERFAAEQTPTTPRPQPAMAGLNTGPTINLTLDEAVRRAVENNLSLAVERLNPQTFDLAAYRSSMARR